MSEIDWEDANKLAHKAVEMCEAGAFPVKDSPLEVLARAYLDLAPRLAAAEKALRDAQVFAADVMVLEEPHAFAPEPQKAQMRMVKARAKTVYDAARSALSASPPQSSENRADAGRGREEA